MGENQHTTSARLKPAQILIKRDPARGEFPSKTVQPPEFWTQQEEVCCVLMLWGGRAAVERLGVRSPEESVRY